MHQICTLPIFRYFFIASLQFYTLIIQVFEMKNKNRGKYLTLKDERWLLT